MEKVENLYLPANKNEYSLLSTKAAYYFQRFHNFLADHFFSAHGMFRLLKEHPAPISTGF
ncbi:hypothetical protein [Hydrogeniiclostridium mannosilyticum]|uniref:hypothetical protein n=1 Tax=Hydrogeniiclostridium mannosilyticum TaxID=2764322 RepID=UPI0018AB13B1|nr:hypothetical protein [Hydrogeniiclostridium mannosilyticum]MBS6163517.1 hypothetical protein [Clostridiales bacterium]